MKILSTGTLSSVTGAVIGSGVSSAPIDLTIGPILPLGIWISIQGDLGRTGGSVAVIAKGCYIKSGVTFAGESTNIVKSGTSKSGICSNGSYFVMKNIVASFMKLEAVASKAGVTNHGSSTTNTCSVKWALMGF